MFEGLTERLGDVFERLTRRGSLSAGDVEAALREVRVALLEADAALPAVRALLDAVKEQAVGQDVLRSVTPGQQVVKIVHDRLVEMLGGEAEELRLGGNPPLAMLMLGLQGSGKTTTTAKLARRLRDRDGKKVLMASVDVYRPAAQQQLELLGKQAGIDTLPIVFGERPPAIARRAMRIGAREGYDIVFIDTAGRLAIDREMMEEAAALRDLVKPVESLLVADAMTGQDAVNTAQAFNEEVGVTGIVLTRIDGDARGGAALSMRHVTGRPIKFVGTGEQLDRIEAFHPDRIASRILGMGDVVGLVERAAETIEQEEAEKLAARLSRGRMDLNDLLTQLRQMKKMGGLGGLMGMLPQVGRMKAEMAKAKIDEKWLVRQEALILSMTPRERARPEIVKASRKRRIAAGAGASVQDVNRMLKQFQQMQTMMKRVGKLEKRGGMAGRGLDALLARR